MRKDAFSLPVGNELSCSVRRHQARSACGDFELQRRLAKIARRELDAIKIARDFSFRREEHNGARMGELL